MQLDAGTYRLTAEKRNWIGRTVAEELRIGANETASINVTLEPILARDSFEVPARNYVHAKVARLRRRRPPGSHPRVGPVRAGRLDDRGDLAQSRLSAMESRGAREGDGFQPRRLRPRWHSGPGRPRSETAQRGRPLGPRRQRFVAVRSRCRVGGASRGGLRRRRHTGRRRCVRDSGSARSRRSRTRRSGPSRRKGL